MIWNRPCTPLRAPDPPRRPVFNVDFDLLNASCKPMAGPRSPGAQRARVLIAHPWGPPFGSCDLPPAEVPSLRVETHAMGLRTNAEITGRYHPRSAAELASSIIGGPSHDAPRG